MVGSPLCSTTGIRCRCASTKVPVVMLLPAAMGLCKHEMRMCALVGSHPPMGGGRGGVWKQEGEKRQEERGGGAPPS
jgi:hypothetical protein